MPFSFREYLTYNDISLEAITTAKRAQIFRQLQSYLKDGGFPEFPKFGRKILRTIYEDIVRKDVIGRKKIKKRKSCEKLQGFWLATFQMNSPILP
jgi:predicted AAA+ superfamily ATPase